jgi:hypothetical protein
MSDDLRIAELAQFTKEGALTPGYGDSYLFFVGRDDVHGALKYLLLKEQLSLKLSMFGYDDDELNGIILAMLQSTTIHCQISLDSQQAGNATEKKLLQLDATTDPIAYSNSVVVTASPTGQILHTKGGVLAGCGMAFEGSTNWSASGEGTDLIKAQSNTLLVTTNPVIVARFSANLDVEHAAGIARERKHTN